jgi:hypothetical protein
MGDFHSFAQILEKKIRKEIEKDFISPSENTSSPETKIQSELWTHLVGQLNTIHFSTDRKGQIYHRNRPAPRPRPDHQMTTEQEQAYQFFVNQRVVLAKNFSQSDLKKAFRILALKLHPDQGGNAFQFQSLIAAKKTLESLFHK